MTDNGQGGGANNGGGNIQTHAHSIRVAGVTVVGHLGWPQVGVRSPPPGRQWPRWVAGRVQLVVSCDGFYRLLGTICSVTRRWLTPHRGGTSEPRSDGRCGGLTAPGRFGGTNSPGCRR